MAVTLSVSPAPPQEELAAVDPSFLSPYVHQHLAHHGGNITLECLATGHPKPRLRWYHSSKWLAGPDNKKECINLLLFIIACGLHDNNFCSKSVMRVITDQYSSLRKPQWRMVPSGGRQRHCPHGTGKPGPHEPQVTQRRSLHLRHCWHSGKTGQFPDQKNCTHSEFDIIYLYFFVF